MCGVCLSVHVHFNALVFVCVFVCERQSERAFIVFYNLASGIYNKVCLSVGVCVGLGAHML